MVTTNIETVSVKAGERDLRSERQREIDRILRPLQFQGDLVLVWMERKEDQVTEGGVIIPGTSKDVIEGRTGIVKKVGDKVTRVKVGDRVLVSHFSGQYMVIPGLNRDHHVIFTEKDIFAVYEREEASASL